MIPRSPRGLDRTYELPNQNRSLEDWHRVRHLDLPLLDAVALDVEAFRVMSRLSCEPDANRRAWLVERRDAVRAERDARRRGSPEPDPTAVVWRAGPASAPQETDDGDSSRREGSPRTGGNHFEYRGGKVVG